MGDKNRVLTAAERAILERLRGMYESLPGVSEERDAFGHVAIRVGKKTLAMLGLENGVPSLGLKSDRTTQSYLVQRGRFYKTPYVGQHGWVSIDGTAAELDWEAIQAILIATYRAVAPKRLVQRLDAAP